MEIVIILALILINGILSMSEIALVSARKSKLETDAKRGSKSAQTAFKLANEPDKFLSTIQIGITLIGIITGLYSGEAFAKDAARLFEGIPALQPYALAISKTIIVIVVTYLTLVFGELVPKRLGMRMAERISKLVAQPMNLLSKIAAPMVWLLAKSTSFVMRLFGQSAVEDNKVTEEEIIAIVREGFDNGELEEVEHDIVERVINLGDRNVGSIMTHRNELLWLDIHDDNDRIREKVQQNLFNAYPVISKKVDNILGVVYLKDLFGNIYNEDFSLEKLLQPANYLDENQSVYKALEQFKTTRSKYGIVTDEFGIVQGIVTLKDIMEALIGQLPEIGEEEYIIQLSDGNWAVDGQCPFYDFLDFFDKEYLSTEYNYNTLSGLILEKLEHMPKTGERLSWQGFNFEIIDMDGVRIDKVLVRVDEEEVRNDLFE
ncbi:MAG: hemolysin family protein [Dysgonomonas sp.]|nr:hemolysin family protein [Dysgonomonas sp.]